MPELIVSAMPLYCSLGTPRLIPFMTGLRIEVVPKRKEEKQTSARRWIINMLLHDHIVVRYHFSHNKQQQQQKLV